MRAIKCTGPGKAQIDPNTPLPLLKPGYCLVKVAAVALNPTDFKHIDHVATETGYNHTCGCDYAGTVVSAPPDNIKNLKPGDRIAGFIHGMKAEEPSSGAFAEYAAAKIGLQVRIPDNMSFEDAAGLPTGINTVGQSLYESMGLQPWPGKGKGSGEWVLIYGGSTGMGMYAVKFAKLSGMKVVTTCSARNFEKVKNLGADAVVDYSKGEGECVRGIKEAAGENLKFAMDCVSNDSSAKICAGALTKEKGVAKYRCLLPLEFPRDDVDFAFTLGYSAVGEEYTFFGQKIVPTEGNWKFSREWWALAEELLAEGKLTPAPYRNGEGGLEGVLEGLDDLRNGRVSGEKLVYRVDEGEGE